MHRTPSRSEHLLWQAGTGSQQPGAVSSGCNGLRNQAAPETCLNLFGAKGCAATATAGHPDSRFPEVHNQVPQSQAQVARAQAKKLDKPWAQQENCGNGEDPLTSVAHGRPCCRRMPRLLAHLEAQGVLLAAEPFQDPCSWGCPALAAIPYRFALTRCREAPPRANRPTAATTAEGMQSTAALDHPAAGADATASGPRA